MIRLSYVTLYIHPSILIKTCGQCTVQIHASASNQEEVQVWEEERKVSRYAESLPQLEAHRKISPNPKVWGRVGGGNVILVRSLH